MVLLDENTQGKIIGLSQEEYNVLQTYFMDRLAKGLDSFKEKETLTNFIGLDIKESLLAKAKKMANGDIHKNIIELYSLGYTEREIAYRLGLEIDYISTVLNN